MTDPKDGIQLGLGLDVSQARKDLNNLIAEAQSKFGGLNTVPMGSLLGNTGAKATSRPQSTPPGGTSRTPTTTPSDNQSLIRSLAGLSSSVDRLTRTVQSLDQRMAGGRAPHATPPPRRPTDIGSAQGTLPLPPPPPPGPFTIRSGTGQRLAMEQYDRLVGGGWPPSGGGVHGGPQGPQGPIPPSRALMLRPVTQGTFSSPGGPDLRSQWQDPTRQHTPAYWIEQAENGRKAKAAREDAAGLRPDLADDLGVGPKGMRGHIRAGFRTARFGLASVGLPLSVAGFGAEFFNETNTRYSLAQTSRLGFGGGGSGQGGAPDEFTQAVYQAGKNFGVLNDEAAKLAAAQAKLTGGFETAAQATSSLQGVIATARTLGYSPEQMQQLEAPFQVAGVVGGERGPGGAGLSDQQLASLIGQVIGATGLGARSDETIQLLGQMVQNTGARMAGNVGATGLQTLAGLATNLGQDKGLQPQVASDILGNLDQGIANPKSPLGAALSWGAVVGAIKMETPAGQQPDLRIHNLLKTQAQGASNPDILGSLIGGMHAPATQAGRDQTAVNLLLSGFATNIGEADALVSNLTTAGPTGLLQMKPNAIRPLPPDIKNSQALQAQPGLMMEASLLGSMGQSATDTGASQKVKDELQHWINSGAGGANTDEIRKAIKSSQPLTPEQGAEFVRKYGEGGGLAPTDATSQLVNSLRDLNNSVRRLSEGLTPLVKVAAGAATKVTDFSNAVGNAVDWITHHIPGTDASAHPGSSTTAGDVARIGAFAATGYVGYRLGSAALSAAGHGVSTATKAAAKRAANAVRSKPTEETPVPKSLGAQMAGAVEETSGALPAVETHEGPGGLPEPYFGGQSLLPAGYRKRLADASANQPTPPTIGDELKKGIADAWHHVFGGGGAKPSPKTPEIEKLGAQVQTNQSNATATTIAQQTIGQLRVSTFIVDSLTVNHATGLGGGGLDRLSAQVSGLSPDQFSIHPGPLDQHGNDPASQLKRILQGGGGLPGVIAPGLPGNTNPGGVTTPPSYLPGGGAVGRVTSGGYSGGTNVSPGTSGLSLSSGQSQVSSWLTSAITKKGGYADQLGLTSKQGQQLAQAEVAIGMTENQLSTGATPNSAGARGLFQFVPGGAQWSWGLAHGYSAQQMSDPAVQLDIMMRGGWGTKALGAWNQNMGRGQGWSVAAAESAQEQPFLPGSAGEAAYATSARAIQAQQVGLGATSTTDPHSLSQPIQPAGGGDQTGTSGAIGGYLQTVTAGTRHTVAFDPAQITLKDPRTGDVQRIAMTPRWKDQTLQSESGFPNVA